MALPKNPHPTDAPIGEPKTNKRKRQSGMALMEMMMALPIVIIALGMFAQMLTAGTGLNEAGREEWRCSSAAQEALELMRNEDFRDIVRLYNVDAFDDPNGPGTAQGHQFHVEGLQALGTGKDGFVGEVVLPTFNAGSEVSPDWQLREDVTIPELGMPRDLNGDAMVDAENHEEDYSILPVLVRLRWQGRRGPREYRLITVLSELR